MKGITMTSGGFIFLFVISGIITAICIYEAGPANAWHRKFLIRHHDDFWGIMMQTLLIFSWLGVIIQLIFWLLAHVAPPMTHWKELRRARLNPPMPAHDEVRAEDFPFRRDSPS